MFDIKRQSPSGDKRPRKHIMLCEFQREGYIIIPEAFNQVNHCRLDSYSSLDEAINRFMHDPDCHNKKVMTYNSDCKSVYIQTKLVKIKAICPKEMRHMSK